MYRRLGVIAAAVVSSWSCYVHTAFRGFSPAPGATVEVTLTPFASDSLTDLLGPGSHALDGTVLPSGPDTLGLAVSRVLSVGGKIQQWRGEHVALPHRAIAAVEGRQFSVPATALVVGAAVTGLVLVANAVKKPPRLPCPTTSVC